MTLSTEERVALDYNSLCEAEERVTKTGSAEGGIAKAVYHEARRQLEFGFSVRDTLERKAQAMLGVMGVSISLVIGLGGKLMEAVGSDAGWFRCGLAALLVVGFTGATLALLGVRVGGDNQQLQWDALFDKEALASKSAWYCWVGVHASEVAENQSKMNMRRGKLVQCAQLAFGCFLALAFVQGLWFLRYA